MNSSRPSAFAFVLPFVSRFILVLLSTQGILALLLSGSIRLANLPPQTIQRINIPSFTDAWTQWDSNWYLSIAQGGYTVNSFNEASNIAFFPLYPLLIRVVAFVFNDVSVAALVIAYSCFFAAILLLEQLLRETLSRQNTRFVITLVVFFPWSFYFSAVYTESLFLLLSVSAFLCASRKQWLLAAFCCILAGATRLQGVALAIALSLCYYLELHSQKRKLKRLVLIIPLLFSGAVAYFAYLWFVEGVSPAAYYAIQQAGWQSQRFNELVDTIANRDSLINIFHALCIPVSLLLVFNLFRKRYWVWGTYTLCSLILSVTSWISLGRYISVLFPLFVSVALLFYRNVTRSILVFVSLIFLIFFTFLFLFGSWVG